jgi:glutaredoxin-like protein
MILSDADRQRIGELLAGLSRPVRLLFFTQTFGCETCPDARRIVDQLAELSPKLSVVECNLVLEPDQAARYGVDRAPTVVPLALEADGTERDYGVRLVGLMAGYELISLIDAITLVSSGDSALTAASRALLARVSEPVTIRVFVTPTCPHCPRAIGVAHRMAIESPFVTAIAVEVSEYPDLIRQYRVNGVPKTVVNDRNELLGAQPEETFVVEALAGLTRDEPSSSAPA